MGNHPALRPYTKQYKSVADQLALLSRRGMEITDFAAAHACLGRIGYYRLSGYWYPFRKSHLSVNPVTGALLRHPITGKPNVVVEDDFPIDPATGQIEFQRWLAKLDATFSRSKDEFAKHFKQKYRGEYPPIWIASELWDFGMLSVFLSGMKHSDQTLLASRYGIPRPELLTSWVRNLNHIRNICAHHGRLWNRSPADQAAPPKLREIPDLDHLIAGPVSLVRLYASAAALHYLLRTINPTSSWGHRLKNHCSWFPSSSVVKIEQAGFPLNWHQLALWS